MEELKSNPLFQFNDNHLQAVREKLGYNDNKLKQDLEQLNEWISLQNHFRVKEFENEYLERLLVTNKGSIERTKKRLDKLCTYTNLQPDFFLNFDVKNEFNYLFKSSYTCILPKPTADNYRVSLTMLTGDNSDDLKNMIPFYRYLIVLAHYSQVHDYCLGYEYILDCKNITLGVLSKINPLISHRALSSIFEAMGQRMKRIHFVSSSKLFDHFVTLVKQGFSANLKQRVLIHSDYDGLYDYIPRENLPKDFGGNEMTVQELTEFQFKEMCSEANIKRLKFMESIGTDESKRLISTFNEEYSGTPGSFKTLCVD